MGFFYLWSSFWSVCVYNNTDLLFVSELPSAERTKIICWIVPLWGKESGGTRWTPLSAADSRAETHANSEGAERDLAQLLLSDSWLHSTEVMPPLFMLNDLGELQRWKVFVWRWRMRTELSLNCSPPSKPSVWIWVHFYCQLSLFSTNTTLS